MSRKTKFTEFFESFFPQIGVFLTFEELDEFKYECFRGQINELEHSFINNSLFNDATHTNIIQFPNLDFSFEENISMSFFTTKTDLFISTKQFFSDENLGQEFLKQNNSIYLPSREDTQESSGGKELKCPDLIKSTFIPNKLIAKSSLKVKSLISSKNLTQHKSFLSELNEILILETHKNETCVLFNDFIAKKLGKLEYFISKLQKCTEKKTEDFLKAEKRANSSFRFFKNISQYLFSPLKFYQKYIEFPKNETWKKLNEKFSKNDFFCSVINWFENELLIILHDYMSVCLSNFCKDTLKYLNIINEMNYFFNQNNMNKNSGLFAKNDNMKFIKKQIEDVLGFYEIFIYKINASSSLKNRYMDFPIRTNLFLTKNNAIFLKIKEDFNLAIL